MQRRQHAAEAASMEDAEFCGLITVTSCPYDVIMIDRALNYGGIMVIIGHELSHAFDDRGINTSHVTEAWLLRGLTAVY